MGGQPTSERMERLRQVILHRAMLRRYPDTTRELSVSPIFWLCVVGAGLLIAGCQARRPPPFINDEPARVAVQSAPPSTPQKKAAEVGDPEAELAWDFLARVDEMGLISPHPPAAESAPPELPPAQPDEPLPPLPALGPAQEGESSGWLTWVPGLSADESGPNGSAQYRTEQDLLKVVAEFQRVATKDTYRFPLPKDVTGANVHKATLTRINDYETKHPGAYPAIIAFTRGRAYEGLHAYERALAEYQRVAQGKSRLKQKAGQAVEALTAFQSLAQQVPTATTAVEYVQALDEQAQRWRDLAQQYDNTSYGSLAQEEEERLERAKVAFFILNRYRIEDGNESVLLAYQQLLDKHRESKNRYRYRLELGDFYVTLAHEYTAQNDPESLRFDADIFETLGRAALQHYAAVAQQDGIMEKLEAKGKLEALEAYMAKVGRLGR